nr:retrovirus-related Pol polyprotein from transposon TNT 1-94 [Tanacetum cinerariifolium]
MILYTKTVDDEVMLKFYEFESHSGTETEEGILERASVQHKPELRPTKDFEANYNKDKAKLALLSLSALASKASTVKNKGLIAEAYERDEEEMSSDDNELVEVKKLDGAEPISGPKTIKLILRSKSTFKAETLKSVIINEPSSSLAKDNKSSSASKVNSAPADVKFVVAQLIPQPDYYDIEWFKKGEALQAKKAEALKLTRVESSNANRSKTSTKRQSHLHKYVEQPGSKVVFVDDSTFTAEGYGSIKCNGIVFTKKGVIENHEKYTHVIVDEYSRYTWIHNDKDHFEKFDEEADDGYLLGYSLVSKAFIDNLNIAKTEKYPLAEYLHPYEPSQRYQTNSNDVSFIEPYECPEPVVLETKVSTDQNGQTDQNDQSIQNDEFLDDDHSEHSNHTNDEQIIDSLPNTKDI